MVEMLFVYPLKAAVSLPLERAQWLVAMLMTPRNRSDDMCPSIGQMASEPKDHGYDSHSAEYELCALMRKILLNSKHAVI
jgi:hypothetical protein